MLLNIAEAWMVCHGNAAEVHVQDLTASDKRVKARPPFRPRLGHPRLDEYQKRIEKIESDVRLLRVGRAFEVDLHQLKAHLRMVQEDVRRLGALS